MTQTQVYMRYKNKMLKILFLTQILKLFMKKA